MRRAYVLGGTRRANVAWYAFGPGRPHRGRRYGIRDVPHSLSWARGRGLESGGHCAAAFGAAAAHGGATEHELVAVRDALAIRGAAFARLGADAARAGMQRGAAQHDV